MESVNRDGRKSGEGNEPSRLTDFCMKSFRPRTLTFVIIDEELISLNVSDKGILK